MGDDCCGGGAPDERAAAQAQLNDLQLQDAPKAAPAAAPVANGKSQKSAHDVVKEKQPYYQRRIDLFVEYRQRQLQALEDAKAANKPLKGTLHQLDWFALCLVVRIFLWWCTFVRLAQAPYLHLPGTASLQESMLHYSSYVLLIHL